MLLRHASPQLSHCNPKGDQACSAARCRSKSYPRLSLKPTRCFPRADSEAILAWSSLIAKQNGRGLGSRRWAARMSEREVGCRHNKLPADRSFNEGLCKSRNLGCCLVVGGNSKVDTRGKEWGKVEGICGNIDITPPHPAFDYA